MMRSLWTASSGMSAQQLNVDTIANNLANVNTAGYKKERLEFQSLLYETMSRANINTEGSGRPINLQVGHGVRPSATGKDFSVGAFQRTEGDLDFALQGDGFFVVRKGEEELLYTRDGSFKLSVNEDGEFSLVTSDGYYILGVDGEPIILPEDVQLSRMGVSLDGFIEYADAEGQTVILDSQIDIVQFSNREGLENVGGNFYVPTGASGQPIQESEGTVAKRTDIVKGYLEMSNVQLAEEMVKLIVAQRAYEINSKAIQTSDDMLQTANTLKR